MVHAHLRYHLVVLVSKRHTHAHQPLHTHTHTHTPAFSQSAWRVWRWPVEKTWPHPHRVTVSTPQSSDSGWSRSCSPAPDQSAAVSPSSVLLVLSLWTGVTETPTCLEGLLPTLDQPDPPTLPTHHHRHCCHHLHDGLQSQWWRTALEIAIYILNRTSYIAREK